MLLGLRKFKSQNLNSKPAGTQFTVGARKCNRWSGTICGTVNLYDIMEFVLYCYDKKNYNMVLWKT